MSNVDFKDNIIYNIFLLSLFNQISCILNCIFKFFLIKNLSCLNNLTNM